MTERQEGLSFPKNIQIETTVICPADCMMCPHRFVSRPALMPLSMIEKIIEECAGRDVTIIPHQMGDALADGRIIDILKSCKEKKLKILLSTSGILLDKERSQAMVSMGVDVINISLDSLNKRLYERIRNLSFDKVMKNIGELLSIKRERTEVWVSAVDIFFDKKSRQEFIDYWKDRVERVQIAPYVRYPKVNNWRLPRKKMNNSNRCQRLETDMVILTNGEVSKCCIDFEGTTSFGNIADQTIYGIWNSDKRRAFIEGLSEEGRRRLYPCNICAL